MKALYITDTHISGKNPLCRTDDLTSLQFDKLIKLVKISNEYEAPIICAGDVFEQPNVSYSIYSKLASILSKCVNGFYTVFGNHDLQFYLLDSWDSTALGALLSSSKTIKHIANFQYDHGIAIDWQDWSQKEPETYDSKAKILVCHKAIVSKSIMESWQENSPEDFSLYNEKIFKDYKLILCGHYHKQYSLNTGSISVVNTGCFTRRKATKIENHLPSYALLDLKKYSFEIKALPNSKPWDEVISDDHLILSKDEKSLEIQLKEFIQLMKRKKRDVSNFLNDLLNIMKDSDEDIREELREILSKTFGEKIDYEILEKGVDYNEIKRFTKIKHKLGRIKK